MGHLSIAELFHRFEQVNERIGFRVFSVYDCTLWVFAVIAILLCITAALLLYSLLLRRPKKVFALLLAELLFVVFAYYMSTAWFGRARHEPGEILIFVYIIIPLSMVSLHVIASALIFRNPNSAVNDHLRLAP